MLKKQRKFCSLDNVFYWNIIPGTFMRRWCPRTRRWGCEKIQWWWYLAATYPATDKIYEVRNIKIHEQVQHSGRVMQGLLLYCTGNPLTQKFPTRFWEACTSGIPLDIRSNVCPRKIHSNTVLVEKWDGRKKESEKFESTVHYTNWSSIVQSYTSSIFILSKTHLLSLDYWAISVIRIQE